jgi:HEAT repeat protein
MSEKNLTSPGAWALVLAVKDGLQRQAAREALVAMGPEATPVLIRLLGEPDSLVRWEAALALKETADPAAAEALVQALKDEDKDVRWVAAEGLAAIGGEAMKPLLQALAKDADSFELRDAAHVAIGLLEDPEQRALLAPVYRAVKDGNAPGMVMMAAEEVLDALKANEKPSV